MCKTNNKSSFNLWAFGCAHIGTDLNRGCRKSLAEAIQHSETGTKSGAPPYDWDIGINIGDLSGSMGLPDDEEGREVVRQYGALKKHPREAVYDVCGNHDRNATWEPEAEWFQKWVDPIGVNTEFSGVVPALRPYSITGTWERFSFRIGNILFLCMSDRNEPSQFLGRGVLGGNPGGVVTGETFRWWKRLVEENQNSIIVTVHHYMLKETTVGSGEWEGMIKNDMGEWHPKGKYHGYHKLGTPQGASYLYWVDSLADSGNFEGYLEQNPGAIALWLGGHTHTNPDDVVNGRSHVETKWGVHFINVSALTRFHRASVDSVPMSRLFMFEDNSNEVVVKCCLHTDHYFRSGFYKPAERKLKLNQPFILST